ncbi:MAG TPA: Imm63 family immunity protein [Phycisphaerae bacterium]|nr:Imm63 family immunity protein [Phycisphaerae bacterium]HRW51543.1 Imm63 family immunity protein [Phycisphaerae bacterium]
MANLIDIKNRYFECATILAAPRRLVRFLDAPQHDGSSHVEIEGNTWVYVSTERGQRLSERRTNSDDEILYWLVSDLTRSMATEFELAHRDDGGDSRRKWFAKDIELLERVNREWAIRKSAEYDRILVEHPFTDEDS